MAKQPDKVIKSWIALNIDEITLFDTCGSPCRRIEMFIKFTGSSSMVLSRTYIKRGQCICNVQMFLSFHHNRKSYFFVRCLFKMSSFKSLMQNLPPVV